MTINQAFADKFEAEKRATTLSKRGSRGDALSQLLREAVNNSTSLDSDDDDELLADAKAQLQAQAAAAREARSTAGGASMANSESDESDSEEDDDGGLLTSELNAKISSTLAAIRSKKPEVYDSGKAFFTEEEMEAHKLKLRAERKNNPKPQSVTQVMARQLLENKADPLEPKANKGTKRKADASGSDSSSDDSDDGGATNSRARLQQLADRPANLTYSQQQQQLKDAFLQSVKAAEKPTKKNKGDKAAKAKKAAAASSSEEDEGEEESDEEVFKVKQRIPAGDQDEDGDVSMADKKTSSSSSSSAAAAVPTGDDFLKTYLSQEWWRQKDLSKLPTYQSIKGEELPEEVSASEDEQELDRVDTYESAYNFRFQEPDAAYQIKSYPRSIEDSLRREDSKRKTARETAKKTKELELLRKKEEIKRLKAEKRKELQRKLKEVESITGLKDTASKFDLNALVNNWDPASHDAMMAKLFGEEDFYADQADAELDEDTLREMVLAGEDMESMGYGKLPLAEGAAASKKKKGKKGKKLDEAATAALEAASATIQRSVKDLQQLDYEDLVGGLDKTVAPTKFRYKEVKPDGLGLTLEQILELTDAELNSKVSLKKLAPYREADDEAEYALPHHAKRAAKMEKYQSKIERKEAWKKAHPSASAAAAANAGHAPDTPAPARSQSQKKHTQQQAHKPQQPKPQQHQPKAAQPSQPRPNATGAAPATAAAASSSSHKKPHTPSATPKPAAEPASAQKTAPAAAVGAAAPAGLSAAQKRRLRKKKLDGAKADGADEKPAQKKQRTDDSDDE